MNQPDLTPRTYIKRCQIRAATRLWMFVTAGCLVLCAVPIVMQMSSAPDPTTARAQERYLQAQSRLEMSNAQTQRLTQQLRQQERELQAVEHLTRRPDWSGVVQLVAQQFNQDLVMTGFQLDDASDSDVRRALGPLAQDIPDDSVWLILNGVAQTNRDVPGLILRLEGLGLFERVVMTGTQREPFAGGQRTGFTLACQVK